MICEQCRGEFDEDEGRVSEGEFYCQACYDESFSVCRYCGGEVWCEETFYDEGYVCGSCYTEHYFSCGCCGEDTLCGDGHETVDYTVCSSCYDEYYRPCSCGDIIHNNAWCHTCGHCHDCCTCDQCDASDECDEVPEDGECIEAMPPPIIAYAGQSVPSNNYGVTCEGAIPAPSPYYDEPIRERGTDDEAVPPRREPARPVGGSTSMPALIQTLDNSAFTLNDTNIKAVLGMLDKSKKLKVDDITGRHCTANDSYFQLPRIVAEIGKVKKPRYFYGVRSNEYDIVLNHSSCAIVGELNSLGLTYRIGTGDRTKVGLSFKVRKRKYDKCVTFLKFLCTT